MEAELQAAATEYHSQLSCIEDILASDPDNAEVKEIYQQLQEALSYTLAALDEQQAPSVPTGATTVALPDSETLPYVFRSIDGDADGAATATGECDGGGEGGVVCDAGVEEGGYVNGGAPTAAASSTVAMRPRGGGPNNARMHPANLYFRHEPDFAALAQEYDELRPYVRIDAAGRAHFDSTSWRATRALTAVLLRHDLGLRWWLPEGQLVPPVTNRANYIHWINDLLHLSAPQKENGNAADALRGLDIGCGANFIYCLLGAVMYGWNMVGVDVTQVAVKCCRQLIKDNPHIAPLLDVRDLSYLHPEVQTLDASAPAVAPGPVGSLRRCRYAARDAPSVKPQDVPCTRGDESAATEAAREVTEVSEGGARGDMQVAVDVEDGEGSTAPLIGVDQGILLPAFMDEVEAFAFSMCNPPFFESMQEAAQNPNTAFGGTAAEMVCPGGELAFVLQMLVESTAVADRVHWFTTMVGKKGTLKALRKELHSRHVTALRTTELAQGKTSRWAVAWSWQVDPNKASKPLRRLEAPPAGPAARATVEPPLFNSDFTAATGGAASSVLPWSGPSHSASAAVVAAGRSRPAMASGLAVAGMPLLPRRHICFTVQQGGILNSRTILGEVQRLLQEGGGCGRVEVEVATWTVTWPLQVGTFTANAEVDQKDEGRNLKRPRPGAIGEGSDGGSGVNSAGNIKVRLRVAQQQRGRFELVATIPNDAPDAVARKFSGLMASLELGLTALGAR